jgi:hypothetical protein
MTENDLVAWCRERIEAHTAMLQVIRLDIIKVIEAGTKPEDDEATLILAKEHPEWCSALIATVKARRMNGKYIPKEWQDFVFDILLGIEKRPDGRGKKSQSLRDEAICDCISKIINFTSLKATRSEADESKVCAVSIVAIAMKNFPGYEGVERIWHRHRQSFRPNV